MFIDEIEFYSFLEWDMTFGHIDLQFKLGNKVIAKCESTDFRNTVSRCSHDLPNQPELSTSDPISSDFALQKSRKLRLTTRLDHENNTKETQRDM